MIYFGTMGRVPVGMVRNFEAYVADADGAYERVTSATTFSSSNPGVAQSGPASRAVSPGSATITARYRGLEASVEMVVISSTPVYPLLSILARSPATIGGRAQTAAGLTRTALSGNENVTAQVAWSSSNPRVATIDQNGLITGVGLGVTLISASLDGLTDWYWLSIAPS